MFIPDALMDTRYSSDKHTKKGEVFFGLLALHGFEMIHNFRSLVRRTMTFFFLKSCKINSEFRRYADKANLVKPGFVSQASLVSQVAQLYGVS